jgi:hypothetical protein
MNSMSSWHRARACSISPLEMCSNQAVATSRVLGVLAGFGVVELLVTLVMAVLLTGWMD